MYSPDYDLLPKLFVLDATIATTGTSADLTAGQFGLFDPETHAVVTTGNVASHPSAYVAVGSYQPNDIIGLSGSYKVSDKSPAPGVGIDPKRVTKWYKVAPKDSQNQVVQLFWDGVTATGPSFECNKTYYLRLELQGEPVLRYINHYIYKQFGVHTGCCADDCAEPCAETGVDAAVIMKQYADLINADNLVNKFAKATAIANVASTTLTTTSGSTAATAGVGTGIAVGQLVLNPNVPYGTTVTAVSGTSVTLSAAATASGTTVATKFAAKVDGTYTSPSTDVDKAAVVAGLLIEAILSPTVFGDCSFTPGEYVEQSFVDIHASMVNENGDPCEIKGVEMNSSTGVNFVEVQPFILPAGQGEFVARDFISSQMYKQVFYSSDPRIRETSDNISLSTVDRTAKYVRYYLQYSKDITGNPSNNLSKDQYILCFAVKEGVSATTFEALVLQWLQAHNSTITLKTNV